MLAQLAVDPAARGLVFDLDGTLVDTMTLHYQAWHQVLARCGYDYPRALFDELAGIPTLRSAELLVARFGWRLDPPAVEREKQAIFFGRLDEVTVIEPVVALARAYHGRLPMAIGTGSRRVVVDRLLAISGLQDLFEVQVTAEDIRRPKPDPDTFLCCAERMGIAPSGCQVFEDSENGLEAARRAGMIPCDVRPFIR